MSIFTTAEGTIETDFENVWTKIQGVFHTDVQPALKSFLQQFSTQFGMQALTASLSAVAAIPTAGFAPTAISLATTLYADAKADAAQDAEISATQMLQTVQSALQVAKAANNVTTAADQTAAQTIAAPTGTVANNPLFQPTAS